MVVAFAGNKADLEDKRKVTAEVSVIFIFNFSVRHDKNYSYFNYIGN